MKDIKDWAGNSIPPVTPAEMAFIQQLTALQRANAHMNKGAYSQTVTEITSRRPVKPVLNIIIPVKGRPNHLRASLASLNTSIEELPIAAREMVSITVAEMDSKAQHYEIALEHADYYTFIKGEMFNKSLLMNTAAKTFGTDIFMFYDVDLIVEDSFLTKVMNFAYSILKRGKTSWVFQPIHERKIFYVHEGLTNKIFEGAAKIKDLRDEKFINDVYIQPTWYDGNYPPGGAVVVSRELFHTIGGYDPELFWGYSPEDRLFLQNCTALCGGEFHTPGDPAIGRMYHLYHPNSEATNFMYEHMVALEQMIAANPAARTCYLVNKHVLENVPRGGGGWPRWFEFFNNSTNWSKDGEIGLSEVGVAALENFSECKHKFIEMVCQWWTMTSGVNNDGHATLHLDYLSYAMQPHPYRKGDQK